MQTLQVWVKLHQLVGLPDGRYRLCGEVRPLGLSSSSSCHYDKQSTILTALTNLDLSAGQRYGSTLILTVHTNYLRSEEVCRLSLPLNWFPSDQTVRDWFPVHSRRFPHLAAQVEVHIVKRHALPPFAAPSGRLLVLPAWSRPGNPIYPPTPFCGNPRGFERLTVPPGPFAGASPIVVIAQPGGMSQQPFGFGMGMGGSGGVQPDDGFYDEVRYPSVNLVEFGRNE